MKKILLLLLILIPCIVNASNNYITYPYNSYTGSLTDQISFGFLPSFQSWSIEFTSDNLPKIVIRSVEDESFVYYTVPSTIFTNYKTVGNLDNSSGNEYIYFSNKIIWFKIYFKNDVNTSIKSLSWEIIKDTDEIKINYRETKDEYLFWIKIKPNVLFTINFNNGTYIYNATIENNNWAIISIPKNELTKFSIDWLNSANLYIPWFFNTTTSYNSYIWENSIITYWKKLSIDKIKWTIDINWTEIKINNSDIKRKPIIISNLTETILPFTDISTSFAKDYIVDLHTKWYVNWYPDNTFKPDQWITRAEFLKIVMSAYWKIDSSDLSETGTVNETDWITWFSDTTGWSVWVAKKAKELWYVNWQNGRFRPNDKVSRAEAIKILINVSWLDTSNYESSTITDTWFDDVKEQWMVKFVAKSKDSWIVSGQNGKFRPNDSITRAEASKIIFNSMK